MTITIITIITTFAVIITVTASSSLWKSETGGGKVLYYILHGTTT